MKIMKWVIAIAICLVVIATLGATKTLQIQQAMAAAAAYPEPSASVNATYTERQAYQPTQSVIGEINAPKHLSLRNELAGTVVAVHYVPGEIVEAGQVLVELDSSEEKARLNAAIAQRNLAHSTYERYQSLFESKRISAEQYDGAVADLRVAEADIANLKSVISKKTLVSPFTARSGIEKVEVGSFLAGNSLITTLVGVSDRMWVDFNVPQFVAELEIGSEVSINKIGHAQNQTQVSATIIAHSPQIQANSRNLTYRAEIHVSEQTFRHNTVVNVTVPVAQSQVVTLVPDTAVSRDHFGEYVFVLETDDQGQYRAQRRKVVLGPQQGDMFTVTDGLDAGEYIATNGAFKLQQDLLVFVQETEQLALNRAEVKL